jgi:iron only hydrogenase large subunit-like protein
MQGRLKGPTPAPMQGSGFQQTTTDEASNAIKLNLQDCLACSGCVTTAEAMLLEHQSAEELLRKLADPAVTVVATLSHQSRASLACAHGLSVSDVRGAR